MDESQSQSRAQQHRTRSRLAADGQTSHRPRAVAGQRAAAKRAGQSGQSVPRSRPVTTAEPERDDELAASVVTEIPAVESDADATDDGVTDDAAEPASASKVRKPSRRQRARTRTGAGTDTQTRSVRRAVVTAVLAVALIAVVAIGAVLTVQYRDVIRTDHARTAAMAAAQREAPVIFSYDYRHLDQDFAKAEALLTGSFRDQYAKTTQTVVKPTALQYHGVVKATVAQPTDGSAAAVSVVSASPDQVVILAFVDQATTSTRVSGTQVDQNRVLLTLTHTSQGWLVSGVDAL